MMMMMMMTDWGVDCSDDTVACCWMHYRECACILQVTARSQVISGPLQCCLEFLCITHAASEEATHP
jgi:hypothetical protein